MTGSTVVQMRDVVARLTSGIVGVAPWQVKLGHGTMATLDFGERLPSLRPGGPERGSLHLWISGAAWRIERDSIGIAGSNDGGSTMADALRDLERTPVKSVHLPSETRDLMVEFEDSLTLRTFRCSTEEDAWRYFYRDEAIFLDGSGEFRLESALGDSI